MPSAPLPPPRPAPTAHPLLVRRGWTTWHPHAGRVVLVLAAFAGLGLALGPARSVRPLASAPGEDWPLSRHDAGRTAATPHELPARLNLQWARELPPLTPAWPDQPKMQFDAAYDPVVLGGTLFVASPRQDTVTALDVETGEERWTFAAEGPVRFAPAAWEGRVFVASDDGYLYCLDADTGAVLWKFRGGPSDRKLLGNGRLISTWPARGGPVVADGTVYFAASIWPFMGVFIHAVDARSGEVVWTNDGDGSIYVKQPHNADSFAGVAPQGALVVAGDYLLVPGGRSVPACYNRHTGKLVHFRLAENGKRGGGADVAALGGFCVNGGAAFRVDTGDYLGPLGDQVVLADDALYSATARECQALDWRSGLDGVQAGTRAPWTPPVRGAFEMPKLTAMIKAGSRLYVAAPGQVAAVELPLQAGKAPVVSWQAAVEGQPVRLLAAADRLFAVTREGRLCCFGKEQVEPRVYPRGPTDPTGPDDSWADKVRAILDDTGAHDGYCVAWGVGTGRLVRELVRQSRLHVVVVDPDADRVNAYRRELRAAGLYGDRVAVHVGDPRTFELPPYLASLMVSEDLGSAGVEPGPEFLRRAFQALRPYGGVAVLPVPTEEREPIARLVTEARLANAEVRDSDEGLLLVREGALPGAADWTHEHADAGNTRVSRDRVVKAPLGLLWFGGPSHEGVLPRHGHGPQPQVLDGRLFIEGADMLRAVDIYTGRRLWEASLPGVGKAYNNLTHQPGANASGSNYVSAPDGIFVAYGKACVRLDPATGTRTAEFPFPTAPDGREAPVWDYVNVFEDYLIGGCDPPTEDDASSSQQLAVMDRRTGRLLWRATARSGFRHNAVCLGNGRLYAIDRLSVDQVARLKKKGVEPTGTPRLVAWDLVSGKEVWSTETDVFGTWLSYSVRHDVLVEAGRVARDTLSDEPKGMRAFHGANGKELWFEKSFVGPAMIHGDTVLKDQSACYLLTGAPVLREDPLSGELVEWKWTRGYGCNTPAASEHLLTFRSGAAGYFDLCHDGGTGNLGGFRSSCTNNLIVAGGLLNAPDYTRTCTCSYQNQTSLALVPMPDAEMWTYFGTKEVKGPVRRVGINLGAPGDRKADDGTLWLEYPSTGGVSPDVAVRVAPENVAWFRHHAAMMEGEGPHWIGASGAKGITSLTVTLDAAAKQERRYTVRLVFTEPDEVEAGERRFDVALQGQEVLADLDVLAEAGGPRRALVKEFHGVVVKKDLTVTLTPSASARVAAPVLCGVEVVAEGW